MKALKNLTLILGILMFAVPAFAQVADDYGTTSSGSYCPKLSITMQRGARDVSYGGQVSELQKFLSDHYDIDPEEIVTGFFGRITQKYVQQFQREQGLPTFGITGSMTRAAIARVCTSSSTNSSSSITPTNTTSNYPPAMRSCLFNNTQIASGASVTAYRFNQVSSGGIGGTCADYVETRTCNNGVFSGSYTNISCRNIASPSTISSEPKCSYTSDSNDRPDNVGFNNQSQNLSGCVASCTMVRDAKWGLNDHGWCHFTETNGVAQMQFVPAASLSDINFTVASSPTSITLEVGQSATDGPNGIRITLQGVQDAYDWSGGVPKASLMVKVSSAPNTGYYLSSSGETLRFADSTSPTGTIDVTISSISVQGKTKTITLQIVAHSYPQT